MKQYLDIMKDIVENGVIKGDRTGTGTISTFGQTFKHKFEDGFPLLTTKRIHTRSVIYELLWFLGVHMEDKQYKNVGKYPLTNTKYLTDNGCTIWDEWADEDGDLRKIYGYQWNNWERVYTEKGVQIKENVNQIDNLINDLKNNPDSRRLMVSAWNPGQLKEMNLPPCHYGFQCYSREMTHKERAKEFTKYVLDNKLDYGDIDYEDKMKEHKFPTRYLSLKWNQRSIDTFLGLPFNIASYSLLTYMLSMVTNHIPYEIIGDLGDTHLYTNHMEYVEKQLEREPRTLPILKINRTVKNIRDFKFEDFKFLNYNPYKNWKNVPIAV